MVVKKYKRNKGDVNQLGNVGAGGGPNPNLTIKEPFVFSEEVVYAETVIPG